jgi:hypothetical protein
MGDAAGEGGAPLAGAPPHTGEDNEPAVAHVSSAGLLHSFEAHMVMSVRASSKIKDEASA